MSTADDIKRLADNYATGLWLHDEAEAEEDALHTAIDALQTERDSLLEALHEAQEFIEGYSDVSDGHYGEPKPNRAMQLVETIRAAIKASEGKAA